MHKRLMYKLAILLFSLALVICGCGDDEDDNDGPTGTGTSVYSVADMEGTWCGIATDTSGSNDGNEGVIGLRFDSLGVPNEIANWAGGVMTCTGAMTVSQAGAIDGNILIVGGTDNSDTVAYSVQGQFVSESELNLTCSVTMSNVEDMDAGDFQVNLRKEGFEYIQVTLNRWEDTDETWWLNIRVYTEAANRVYAKGTNIQGEYDLFQCWTFGSVEHWWSSNNANCEVGDNNYSFHYVPELPFNIEVHTVTSTGDVTHTITISDYLLVSSDS